MIYHCSSCSATADLATRLSANDDDAVGLDPHWQKGWFRLASALEGLGLLGEAETALDIAIPLDPGCVALLFSLVCMRDCVVAEP